MGTLQDPVSVNPASNKWRVAIYTPGMQKTHAGIFPFRGFRVRSHLHVNPLSTRVPASYKYHLVHKSDRTCSKISQLQKQLDIRKHDHTHTLRKNLQIQMYRVLLTKLKWVPLVDRNKRPRLCKILILFYTILRGGSSAHQIDNDKLYRL